MLACSTAAPRAAGGHLPLHHPGYFPQFPSYLGRNHQLGLLKSKAHSEIPGVPAFAAWLPVQDAERCPALPCQLCLQQLLLLLRPYELLLDSSRKPGQGCHLAPQHHPAHPGRALQELPQLSVRHPERQLRQAGQWDFLHAAPGHRFPQALGLGQGLLGAPGGSVPWWDGAGSPLLVWWDAVEDAAGP